MAPLNEQVNISILYVEDEPEARGLVSSMLTGKIKGLTLHTADNGATAVDLYRAHRPDIVVTDILMPVMDGIRMVAEIKALDPDALIIAVTAHSDTRYLLKAIELGINHYVLKPVDYEKLFAAIDKCIEIITLKKKVETQNQHIRKLSRAIEDNPCSIIITDPRGVISYVNPVFTRLTGFTAEEAIGQTPKIMNSGQMPPSTYQELWSTITAGKEWHGEFLNRKKNGELYWESASISPIFNDQGVITSYVAVKEDITERKRHAERIEVLNTDLAARASELEAANQDLEAFSYTVSHDLRKPLTNISCFCQVIQEVYGVRLEEECRDYVRDILAETFRMDQLISTILTFSRLSRNPLNLGPVDLSGIAANVVTRLGRGEPGRQHRFRIGEGIVVEGDYKLLQVVMENLLGNAWKYSSTRERTEIEFGAFEMRNGEQEAFDSATGTRHSELVYFVRDNGVGFDMKEAGRLFNPFERLHDSREFEGHGIGLATVNRIILRHGGRIWAESSPDKGATFFFTLPDRKAP